MIKIVEQYVSDGHDCWGRTEYKTVYYVYKNGELIAKTPFNPNKLFKDLGIDFIEETYD